MVKVEMVNADGKHIENNNAIWDNHPDIENVCIVGMIVPEGYVTDAMIQTGGVVTIRIRKV